MGTEAAEPRWFGSAYSTFGIFEGVDPVARASAGAPEPFFDDAPRGAFL
ncbi:MAG: hypothetical protein AVDCRST_MAG25-3328 [uncultured Rubrobacteraceae bacterium]|uniref:Uncharacterized protein n=1 Tax=uncultured Rubrobacteraceae bacterium TaxID=349277 RepID=A0A6J4SAH7_9ACTN|nr:MAG: hypothetical protein AVDCRST_MAG25-3328 [uncultured Rubrobacteraceae bacterium]